MGKVEQLPPPEELTEQQREYWEQQLTYAETAYKYALRMLGRLGVEGEEGS